MIAASLNKTIAGMKREPEVKIDAIDFSEKLSRDSFSDLSMTKSPLLNKEKKMVNLNVASGDLNVNGEKD